MRTHRSSNSARGAQRRGFAIVLDETEYVGLIPRQGVLHHPCHGTYLAEVHRRMRSARRAGARVVIAPFRADQHISYSERIGAPPFGTIALRAFDDYIARTCPLAREWRGEPIDRVIADLRATCLPQDRGPSLPGAPT